MKNWFGNRPKHKVITFLPFRRPEGNQHNGAIKNPSWRIGQGNNTQGKSPILATKGLGKQLQGAESIPSLRFIRRK